MTTYVRWPCIYYSRLPNRRGVRKVHAGWFTKLERGRAVRIARKLTERDRQYLLGRLPPNYPVPALLIDSCSDLGHRWSNWYDTDHGLRF